MRPSLDQEMQRTRLDHVPAVLRLLRSLKHVAGSAATVLGLYVAWIVTMALATANMLVWRSVLLELYIRLRLDKWKFGAFNNAIVLLFALSWIVLVVATEEWYRRSAGEGLLARRALRVILSEAGVLAAGYLLERVV
jgi:hypothetical protein